MIAFRSTTGRPRVLPIDAVEGAAWQRGLSSEYWRYHVLLDGRPVHLAVAANAADGWVEVETSRRLDEFGFVTRGTERRRGRVRIVRSRAA